MTAEMAEPLRAAVQRYFVGHATGSPTTRPYDSSII